MSRITGTKITEVLRVRSITQIRHSARGTPRWILVGETADGRMRFMTTACTAGSAYSCNLNQVSPGALLLVHYHQTPINRTVIADQWKQAVLAGADISAFGPFV
jgi:hypothetical protein